MCVYIYISLRTYFENNTNYVPYIYIYTAYYIRNDGLFCLHCVHYIHIHAYA